MEIAIEAMIKQITNKSLVSGDKATNVLIQFDSNDKLKELNALNSLHHADKNIMVVFMEKPNTKIV